MYKPIQEKHSIHIATSHTKSWLLRYLSKLQDKTTDITMRSHGVITELGLSSWENTHLMRSELKAGAVIATNAVPKEMPNVYEALDIEVPIKQNTVPEIHIFDDRTPLALILSAQGKRSSANGQVFITHTGNEVHLAAVNADGRLSRGHELTVKVKPNDETLEATLLAATTIFLLVNKIVAGEPIIKNIYPISPSDIIIG